MWTVLVTDVSTEVKICTVNLYSDRESAIIIPYRTQDLWIGLRKFSEFYEPPPNSKL